MASFGETVLILRFKKGKQSMMRACLSLTLLISISSYAAHADELPPPSTAIKFKEAWLACGIGEHASSKCDATVAVTTWCAQHSRVLPNGIECAIPWGDQCGAACAGEAKAMRVDLDCIDRNGAIISRPPIVHSTRSNLTIECLLDK
jgi:hypothetical protein